MYPWMALKSQKSACLCLLSAWIKDVCHHNWPLKTIVIENGITTHRWHTAFLMSTKQDGTKVLDKGVFP